MEFKLPEIGEGLQEGELISWLVKDGDTVEADQPLLEVMTDKATVEVPSPAAGTVSGITAKEGDIIKVGETLANIDEGAAPQKATPAKEEEKSAAPAAPKEEAKKEKGFGIFAEDDKAAAPVTQSAPAAKSYTSTQENLSPSNVPAAPLVRSMAQQAGVDLAQVSGSGPSVGGTNRVLEKDLLAFLNGQQQPAATNGHANGARQSTKTATPSVAPAASKALPTRTALGDLSEEVERKPMRGLRRVISQAMSKSKFTAPHYSYVDEFECSDLIALRKEAKKAAADYGVNVSYLPFIVKALVGALKEYPVANSSLEENDKGSELVLKKFYHIGIAVATDDGLVVPVIKHADKKSILEIAQEITELSAKTRAGKATSDELRGSTFTITSMGNLGGKFATPIINYPEVGILGVYRAQEKPVVKDGQIVVGNVMPLSLSLDHRVVDGAVGSLFCTAIIDRLKNPAKLLLEMI